jgi:hypothetical protein
MLTACNKPGGVIGSDGAALAIGGSRADLALSILKRESLSPEQVEALRQLLVLYERGSNSCGRAAGELLPSTKETSVGAQLVNVQAGKRRLMVVTGGQSSVDRAALDAAVELTLPCRGWCPAERWAEDGTIASRYPMQECGSSDPATRTELNTIDSDATLVLTKGNPTDGTPLTSARAEHHGKPTFVLTLGQAPDVEAFWRWIERCDVRILNIGGPRESFAPGEVYRESRAILDVLLNPTTPRAVESEMQVQKAERGPIVPNESVGISTR